MRPSDYGGAPTSTDALERLRTRVSTASQVETSTNDGTTETEAEAEPDPARPSLTTLIQHALDATGSYYIVEDGEVYGRWEQGLFHFTDLGSHAQEPVIQVHGTWERCLDEEALADAAVFCNEWNAASAWPKAYAQLDEDHRIVGIFGETTVDLSVGLSPALIELVLAQGIETALGLFESAAEAFPDARLIQ